MNTSIATIKRHNLWHHTIDMFLSTNCLVIDDEEKFIAFLKETEPETFKEWLNEMITKGENEPLDIVITKYNLLDSEKPFAHNVLKELVRGMDEQRDGTIYCKNIVCLLSNMTKEVIHSVLMYDLNRATISPEILQEFRNLVIKKGGNRSRSKSRKATSRKMRKTKKNCGN
jgi:hypothetical protein